MKTSHLIAAGVLTLSATLAVATTYAATSTTLSSESPQGMQYTQKKQKFAKMNRSHHGSVRTNSGSLQTPPGLTAQETTAFQSMSDTEKRAFLEQKRSEMEAKRAQHEAIIDKLLAGTSLTSEEELIRQEMIKRRAEMKAEQAKQDALRAEFRTLIEKKDAGTTLTDTESARLTELQSSRPMRGGHGPEDMTGANPQVMVQPQ